MERGSGLREVSSMLSNSAAAATLLGGFFAIFTPTRAIKKVVWPRNANQEFRKKPVFLTPPQPGVYRGGRAGDPVYQVLPVFPDWVGLGDRYGEFSRNSP